MASAPWNRPRVERAPARTVAHPAAGTRRAAVDRRARRKWDGRRVLSVLFAAVLGASLLLAAGTTATYAYVSRTLPDPKNILSRKQFETTRVYDRNGVLLHEVYDPNKGKRTEVPLSDVPAHVRNAFLAAEDARFYQNPGIDFQGVLRAFLANVRSRGTTVSGGSTITQQLVKNTMLSDERTMSRKIKEAFLAIDISRRYSKDQILEMYLNTSFFGNQATGIQAAAQTYFGKDVQDLTPAEGAMLAGLVRSPSSTNPFADEQAARAEQKRVLDAEVRHGFMKQEEEDTSLAQPLNYNRQKFDQIKAPHFVQWVEDQLAANPKYGQQMLREGGLEVTTSLDVRLQELGEQIVRDQVAKLGNFNVHDGALTAVNPQTGEILAMVGSADFNNKNIQGEVNVALALRQPGSSIKPITYEAAFLKGWSPGTIIEDTPTDFPQGTGMPPYRPKNYDGAFHGKVTARTALANSYNIPAVKTLQFVGVPAMIDLARKMGITTFDDPNKYGLSVTLGGAEVRMVELAGAYAVFANGGSRVSPVSILKVVDTRGHVLDQFAGPQPQPVLDAAHAYLITSILSDNQARTPAFGPNSPLKLSRPAAVKTGTTDDYKDNWTVGYTSQLVTAVWVGNADNSVMRGTTGITGAAPIWHDFMEEALKPLPVDKLDPPPGVQKASLTEDGKLWQEGCGDQKVDDLVVTGQASGQSAIQKCTPPTATPEPTKAPETPPAIATESPKEPATPAPSTEELRARAAGTATADAKAFATRYAEQQRSQPATAPTQPPAQPTAAPAQPTTAPTRAPAQPTVAPTQPPAATATRVPVQPTVAPTQPPAPTAAPQTAGVTSPAPTATPKK